MKATVIAIPPAKPTTVAAWIICASTLAAVPMYNRPAVIAIHWNTPRRRRDTKSRHATSPGPRRSASTAGPTASNRPSPAHRSMRSRL